MHVTSKLFDGYTVSLTNGQTAISGWIDLHAYSMFDMTLVVTGGTAAGTFKIQKSNDSQWGGGNRPGPIGSAGIGAINDTMDCPTGQGTVSVAVAGPGTFTLNQWYVGYRWMRVVFTASGTTNTKFDVFVNCGE